MGCLRLGAWDSWYEDEFQVTKMRHFSPGEGKAGKGLVHCYAVIGGYRCIDVEDVVGISGHPTMPQSRVL